LHFPPNLRPGDVIRVVAPSGPVDASQLLPGLAWLRARYELRMTPGVFARDAFLAGDDARRRDELVQALCDPEAKAVVATRGGYGALRIARDVPWDDVVRRPRWIVGFSDVTVLHAMAWRAGMASVHGPNVAGLGTAYSPLVREAWIEALERPTRPRTWSGLRVLTPGRARGIAVGGNLALVHAVAAAGCLAVPEGAVLFLEDVSEAPYRVDRMLTSLLVGGHLARASAIVFGGFDRCEAGPDGRSVHEVIDERTRRLGVPVLAGAPFGHRARNEAFVLGAPVRVAGDEVVVGAT
jgi:muramoyltetrapeptide carboxypeptidase